MRASLMRLAAAPALLRHELSQELEILLVAVGRQIEVGGNPRERLALDLLLVRLGEPLIRGPRNARGFHRGLLAADRDLMRMQIVRAELVQERLLDDLMGEEEGRDIDALGPGAERTRKVAVDVDSTCIHAVAGNVRDIVAVVDFADAPAQRLDHIAHGLIGNILRSNAHLILQLHGNKLIRQRVRRATAVHSFADWGEPFLRASTFGSSASWTVIWGTSITRPAGESLANPFGPTVLPVSRK